MKPMRNIPLANYTSLAVGGPAEELYSCRNTDEFKAVLAQAQDQPVSVLGYGANVLVSDAGLPGIVVLLQGGSTQIVAGTTTIIADAGVWWDDLVQYAIAEDLWGLELMSAIPGGVGAAVVGNIAAYGQAVADTLIWVEVFDTDIQETRKLTVAELGLTYRFSNFQTDEFKSFIILRAAFTLSPQPTKDVVYQSALDIAQENSYDLATLDGRRQTILETRGNAGSLWDYRATSQMHTAGSFFRNPTVDADTAETLITHDETGRTADMIKQMNLVHGGDQQRVSAAHVLLAAGFARGQAWGPVRLHPDHILKIENTGSATAQQIYDVAQEIIATVKAKLNIDLVPEVRFLGEFKETTV